MPSKTVYEIPGPHFELKLSSWDKRFPTKYSRRVFCVALKKGVSHETMIYHLRNALTFWVDEYPCLTGLVVPLCSETDGTDLRDIHQGGSVKLLVHDLTSNLDYEVLKSAGFPQASLNHADLCPFDKISHSVSEPCDVCRVQANLVSGGVLLTISISNILSDGRGISDMIGTFAKSLRCSQEGGPRLESGLPYRVDRTVTLKGRGGPGNIDSHPAWMIVPDQNSYSNLDKIITPRQNFSISAANLIKLKQDASTYLNNSSWISTHDAVVGLIWRSLIVARRAVGMLTSDQDISSITQAVDCRGVMSLPKPYIGNAIHAINPQARCADLVDAKQGLSFAALTMRQAILDTTREDFEDLLDFIENTDKLIVLSVLEQLNKGGIFLTSHFKFGMCDLDFGPCFEKIDACLQPTSTMLPGTPHILSKMPDGSCVVMFNERDDVMAHLSSDSLFTRYAKAIDGCM